MENELINIEDEVYIKEINGIKAIHYKINYNNQNILKDKIFKNWLNEEITKKKGKKCTLYKCSKCDFFLYGKFGEIISFPHCKANLDTICSYCGKQYHDWSFCCSKRGLMNTFFDYFFPTYKETDCYDYNKLIPFLFNIFFIGMIYCSIFLYQKLKVGNEEFSCYLYKDTKLSHFAMVISVFFTLLYSLVYFFVFLIIYFLYLILYFIMKPYNIK